MLKHWKLALVAASLLIGGVALAQSPTDQGSKDQPAQKEGGWHKRGDKRVGKKDDAASAKRRADMLAKYDTNKDGKLDATERAAMQKAKAAEEFARLDKNHDGVLTLDEAQPLFRHHGKKR